jgi:hypothetical protein
MIDWRIVAVIGSIADAPDGLLLLSAGGEGPGVIESMPGSYSMSGEMSGSSLGGRARRGGGLAMPATAAAGESVGAGAVGAVDDSGLSGIGLWHTKNDSLNRISKIGSSQWTS